MGWKLVRDNNEAWCREHGVSGQWRTSPDPESSLYRKIFEEGGEGIYDRDPGELYDLLDVVRTLIPLADPSGEHADLHAAKVVRMGGFGRFIEWNPVPEEAGDDG